MDVGQRRHQLGMVQRVVGARRHDHLGLLLQVEVAPGVVGVHVLLVQSQALVVRNGACTVSQSVSQSGALHYIETHLAICQL